MTGIQVNSSRFSLCSARDTACCEFSDKVSYISSLYDTISHSLPSAHGYADDNQLYLSFRPSDKASEDNALTAMQDCICSVRDWLINHELLINDCKTEIIFIGTKQRLAKVSLNHIFVGNAKISCTDSVKNLGVFFDQNLTMGKQISKVCSNAFYQLYKLKQIRKFLINDTVQLLVHAFVTSNLDYCNGLYYGISQYLIDKLQRIQNAALA